MQLRTIEQLQQLKNQADEQARSETGNKANCEIWGSTGIPVLVAPEGQVLYQDDFAALENWHHEGTGDLTQPAPGVMQLNCIGSRQGRAGCMAFCRTDFPDNICVQYSMRALTNRGLLITFLAARGRQGEDMLTELPEREGIFADYILNPDLRCYHVSVSRYDDTGTHTGVSNWRRNPGIFMMAQQKDLCRIPNTWYDVTIVKHGKLLQMAVNGELAGGFIDRDDVPEPIPSEGKVGFRSIGADVRVQIRNFRVSAL